METSDSEPLSPDLSFSNSSGASGTSEISGEDQGAAPVAEHSTLPPKSKRLAPNSKSELPADSAPLGVLLEPVLRENCAGRLSAIHWFRTDWQRSGALTGYATWKDDDEILRDVVVKMPLPPRERQWLAHLQEVDHLVPKLYAHDETIGSYDMAWVVMERLPHGPLGAAWGGREFDLLIEAIGRFYVASSQIPIHEKVTEKDWEKVFHLARENVINEHDLAHEQRWKAALKKVHRKLKEWLKIWGDRPCVDWCHGDLHLGNAMSRHAAPQGSAVLLDFALTHPGHWIEDAVYFEHLYWARRQRLGDRKLCSLIAKERKKHGLKVDADWPRLASIKRAFLAMSTPAQLDLNGNHLHVEAALQVLEIEAGA